MRFNENGERRKKNKAFIKRAKRREAVAAEAGAVIATAKK
jgi:hypothetical protein